jgi:hypothetical protein
MLRSVLLKKSVVVFLLFLILTDVCAPTISWALTSGPTAPEYSSFEPVDTTDMVNLSSGDFTYNIPLLEVPGPSGGFPLSLSYHAGVMPEEESSWVGLGWSLNPGAIMRQVSGYPDDQFHVQQNVYDHWELGERNTFGIGVGISKVVSVGAEVSFDSNQGFGVGISGTVGFGNKDGSIKGGVSGSMNTYGDYSLGIGVSGGGKGITAGFSNNGYFAGANVGPLSAGYNSNYGAYVNATVNLSGNISVSTDFNSVTIGGQLGIVSGSATITSNGVAFSGSSSLVSATNNNSKIGKVSVESESFSADMFLFNVSYSHQRWFSDERDGVTIAGALHADKTNDKDPETWGFDSYAIFNPAQVTDLEKNDPERSNGGSFPAYDNYLVNAQGVSGTISPHIFTNGTLFRKNVRKYGTNDPLIKYRSIPNADFGKVSFRYKNDFSNALTYSENAKMLAEADNVNQDPTTIGFVNTQKQVNAEGYNADKNQLAGSQHIEYYTNYEIRTEVAKQNGFIDYTSSLRAISFERGNYIGNAYTGSTTFDIASQIGGFSITNASGVRYHFALPAYAHSEFHKTAMVDNLDNLHEETKAHPYAYTWLLTAITGPDFVDRGGVNNQPNGILDENDWGYWVKLVHVKNQSDDFLWRVPAVGFSRDIDTRQQVMNVGLKQLYFLERVETSSHVALFKKFYRDDSKEVNDPLAGGFRPYPDVNNITSCMTMCQYTNNCPGGNCPQNPSNQQAYNQCIDYCQNNPQQIYPESPQGLQEIVLLKRDHYTGGAFNTNGTFSNADVLRSISFSYDYSLCPETINSYQNLEYPNYKGKLTLNSIKFHGKGKADNIIPPMKFTYELENPKMGLANLSAGSSASYFIASQMVGSLTVGDLVKYESNGKTVYSAVVNSSGAQFTLKTLGSNSPIPGPINWIQTKNPPYSPENRDNWGYYKSDYTKTATDNTARQVTTTSASSVDVWSLRKIETSLGATISVNYQSDQYSKSIYSNGFPIVISSIDVLTSYLGEFRLNISSETNAPLSNIKSGDWVKLVVVYGVSTMGSYNYNFADSRTFSEPTIVQSVTPNSIVVRNKSLLDVISAQTPNIIFPFGGSLSLPSQVNGGGLRVERITLTNPATKESSSTIYSYHSVSNNYPQPFLSSGVTSYEPSNLPDFQTYGLSGTTLAAYKTLIYSDVSRLIGMAHEIPGPAVLYEFVTVEEEIAKPSEQPVRLPQKVVYQFEVPKYDDVEFDPRTFQVANQSVPCILPSCEIIQSLQASGWTNPCGLTFTQAISQCSTQPTVINTIASVNSVKPAIVRDFSSRIGSLKSTKTFTGAYDILTETTNYYLHDDMASTDYRNKVALDYSNQGTVTEIFNEYREVKLDDGSTKFYKLFTRKEKYPNIFIGNTTKNYKTGLVEESKNIQFDFYSGVVTKTLVKDALGNSFVSESVPAYRIPDYSGMTSTQINSQFAGMGLLVNNPKNKHMLTQTAAAVTYKVNDTFITSGLNSDKLGLVSASAQTWSDQINVLNAGGGVNAPQTGIWRQLSNFNFIADDNISLRPDGLYPYLNFTEFNSWSGGPAASTWKELNKVKLYDVYSHGLEATDMNGNFAATKMSLDQTRVFATVANARYDEFAFSGFEETPDANNKVGGGVKIEGGVNLVAHTGQKSVQASAGGKGFSYAFNNLSSRKYRISVWSNQSNALLKYSTGGVTASTPVSTVKQAGAWYLVEAEVELPAGSINVWCEAVGTVSLFDDFRLHPLQSAMVSYVYNGYGELSYILDNNNLYTEYKYDPMGRLHQMFKESFQYGRTKTGETTYHYANSSN